nr:glycoside hydrolase family 3 C-terminal domain-containing protein [Candidatus Sigynarchaeota archaeon]
MSDIHKFPFRNPELPLEERLSNLVGLLTTEEKIKFLYHESDDVPRLGIKHYNHGNEALHGVVRPGKATVFPMAIAFAATWNPELIFDVATAISDEARAKYYKDSLESGPTGLLTFWSPTVNMARDPRWGRTAETYGEDPWLTSRIGIQFVRGLQGNDPKYLKVVSTPKHFAGNNEEHNRHNCNPNITMRDAREYFLPQFKALIVEGKAQSIMGAYNAIFGTSCCQNKQLLTDILRNEWGFKGYVVTDCGAVGDAMPFLHNHVRTFPAAVAMTINAGVDLECGPFFKRYLMTAIKKGLVTEETLTRAVTNVLRGRFKLGLFDPVERCPYSSIPYSVVGCEKHSNLALRVAHESIILLKNKRQDGSPILPLDKAGSKRIVVVGPNADVCQFGDYSGTPVNKPVSPVAGIIKKFGESRVDHVQWNPPRKKQRFQAIPARNLKPTAECKKHEGLKREFYPSFDFQGNGITGVDAQINFDWGPRVNDPSISNAFKMSGIETDIGTSKESLNHFSLRWTGFICPDVAGEYEIRLESGGIGKDSTATMRFQGNDVGTGIKTTLECSKAYEICVEFPRLEAAVPNKPGEPGKKGRKKPGMVKQFLRTLARHWRRQHQLAGMPSNVSLQWRMPASAGDPAFPREVAAAKQADIVIACLGLGLGYEREGHDKNSLELPPEQDALMRRLAAVNPNTIAVLITGSPVSFPWIDEHIPGILLAWYPGERGGDAIGDILSGDVNPSGRLPITFYRSTDQLPPFDEYDLTKGKTYWYFAGEPLYPFGFGLSFTAFAYKAIKTSPARVTPGDVIKATVHIANEGDRAGDEVVQLYVRYVKATGAARANEPLPRLQLKAFKRVHLQSGTANDVELEVPVQNLALYNSATGKNVVLGGTIELIVGPSSRDVKLVKAIDVEIV